MTLPVNTVNTTPNENHPSELVKNRNKERKVQLMAIITFTIMVITTDDNQGQITIAHPKWSID